MIKKTLAIIFILSAILVAVLEWNNHVKYVRHIDQFANYIYSYTDSIVRQNSVINKIVRDHLNSDHIENIDLLKKLCKTVTEESVSAIEIAEGYDCLGQLESLESNQISQYNAIKYLSYAARAYPDQKY
ncbi:MAG: hypothetical protein AABY27_07130, partial [Pseudomonadota bacterium]